jgi:hypothetical protein
MGELRVWPLLVCWGPDVVDLPEGWIVIEGVVVVVGRQATSALPLALASGQTLPPPVVDQALEQIDAFMARRDRHERQHEQVTADRRFSPRLPLKRSA